MIARKRLSLLLAALLLAGMLTAALPVSAHADGTPAIVQGTDPVTRGNKVWFGVLTDSDDYYYKFRNQPVVWRVLDPGNTKSLPVTGSGEALLVSDGILSSQMQFGSSSNVWADSQVKSWCGTLYSDLGAEKYAVSATSVTEDDSYYYRGGHNDEEFGGASLNAEKFFALSAEEACTYFENDDDRVASGGSYECWLRSPFAYINDYVGRVDIDGWLSTTGYDNTSPGVRPAFNLNLSSVLFSSAAAGGKSGEGTLTAVSDYSGTEWKLTLKDSGRNGFRASATSRTGSVWTIQYSGAKTGTNESISAVIIGSDGAVKYYGRLGQSAGSGAVKVDVSGKLGSGDTLYVYNEQYNGDKRTDFASALQEITEPAELTPTKITVTAQNIPEGEDETITVKLSPSIGGATIEFGVYSEESSEPVTTGTVTTDETGQAQKALSGLTAGKYSVTASFKGDAAYAGSIGDGQFTVSAAPEPTVIIYKFTSAAGTYVKKSGQDAVFVVKGEPDDSETFDNFDGASVDGSTIPAEGYTAAAGSVKLTLKGSYLDTLSAGQHTLKATFRDGGSAETKFTIKDPAKAAEPVKDVPKTGDAARPGVWGFTGAAALIAAGACALALRKRKEEQAGGGEG